jgi:hypothetical protein
MKKEVLYLDELSKNEKILFLKELDFNSDGEYVFDNLGNKLKDKYLDIFIKLENMMILPGSTIILDNNDYSLIRYIDEFGEL